MDLEKRKLNQLGSDGGFDDIPEYAMIPAKFPETVKEEEKAELEISQEVAAQAVEESDIQVDTAVEEEELVKSEESLDPVEERSTPIEAEADGEQEVPEAERAELEHGAILVQKQMSDVQAPLDIGDPYGGKNTSVSPPRESVRVIGSNGPVQPVSVVSSIINSRIPVSAVKEHPSFSLHVEEDILVPDVKPDLASILLMDGEVKLERSEVYGGKANITGYIQLQTLYLPEISRYSGGYGGNNEGDSRSNSDDKKAEIPNLISAESRVLFRHEAQIQSGGNGPISGLVELKPQIESLEHFVINERKYRVRANVKFVVKEYGSWDINLFEGIKGERIETRKEPVSFMEIVARKKDLIEVKETFALKDNMPAVQRLVKSDIKVVEGTRQINKNKAIVSGVLLMQILYVGEDGEEILTSMQEKTDFTHFMKLTDIESRGLICGHGEQIHENLSYNLVSSNIELAEDEEMGEPVIQVNATVGVDLEIFKTTERSVVTDLYHKNKILEYKMEPQIVTSIQGNNSAETSIREIITPPKNITAMNSLPYLNCEIKTIQGSEENGRFTVTGTVAVEGFCLADEGKQGVAEIKKEFPFKCSMDPGASGPNTEYLCQGQIKDFWYDKANNQQAEFNCTVGVKVLAMKASEYPAIREIYFIENDQADYDSPSMVLYIAQENDTVWDVAKQFRTTTEDLMEINDIHDDSDIFEGRKLLIV